MGDDKVVNGHCRPGSADETEFPTFLSNGVKTTIANGGSTMSTGHEANRKQSRQIEVEAERKRQNSCLRVYKSACIYATFITVGLGMSSLGTAIVHMEQLFQQDTATMSWTFSCHGFGMLTGTILSGLIHDRLSRCHELMFAVAVLVEALSMISAPFAANVFAYFFVVSIQGTSRGFVCASGQSYLVNMWSGHRFKGPVLQAVHGLWSLGACIGPFIISCFLVDLKLPSQVQTSPDNSSTPSNYNCTPSEDSLLPDNNTTSTAAASTDCVYQHLQEIDVSPVRFAYVVLGTLTFIPSLMFLVVYCRFWSRRRPTAEPRRQSTSPDIRTSCCCVRASASASEEPADAAAGVAASVAPDTSRHRNSRHPRVMFIILAFFFYHVYCYAEVMAVSFFAPFTIKFLQWPVRNASLLMSLFYGFHFLGRLVGVPLSAVLRPRTMLAINVSITAVAYILLMSVQRFQSVMWVSAALAAASLATDFASAVLWAADTVTVSGRIASVMFVGASTGGMVAPLVGAALFGAPGGPMCLVYGLVAAAIAHIVVYCLMVVVGRAVTRSSDDGAMVSAVDEREEVPLETKKVPA